MSNNVICLICQTCFLVYVHRYIPIRFTYQTWHHSNGAVSAHSLLMVHRGTLLTDRASVCAETSAAGAFAFMAPARTGGGFILYAFIRYVPGDDPPCERETGPYSGRGAQVMPPRKPACYWLSGRNPKFNRHLGNTQTGRSRSNRNDGTYSQ